MVPAGRKGSSRRKTEPLRLVWCGPSAEALAEVFRAHKAMEPPVETFAAADSVERLRLLLSKNPKINAVFFNLPLPGEMEAWLQKLPDSVLRNDLVISAPVYDVMGLSARTRVKHKVVPYFFFLPEEV